MAEKLLMKGNHVMAQAAINAGCQCYFGYPITPQSEIGEETDAKMPELGRVFIPAESEIAAINMVLGAGATGTKAMTSSSSCAIALMQEALSFMAGSETPGVIASVMRAGPGLGNITPSQGDYTQTVKGGGNGDYRIIALAPSTLQEMADLTYRAFYLSQKYRNPTFILADGIMGQMMEPVIFNEYPYPEVPTSGWAITGAKNREARWIGSLEMGEKDLQDKNINLFKKYELLAENETSYEALYVDDADLVITAFGSSARIAKSVIKKARENGLKVGLFRPITLFPFPEKALNDLAGSVKVFLDIEMNLGQMLQDVKLAVNGKAPVEFLGVPGGLIPSQQEIYNKIVEVLNKFKVPVNGI